MKKKTNSKKLISKAKRDRIRNDFIIFGKTFIVLLFVAVSAYLVCCALYFGFGIGKNPTELNKEMISILIMMLVDYIAICLCKIVLELVNKEPDVKKEQPYD